MLSSVAGTGRQQTAECSSKLGIKDGVDDRIEKTVDVAKPDEEREQSRVNVTDWATLDVVTDTNCVDDV